MGGSEYEMATYKGEWRNGKREGKGKMVWADGSSFDGIWKNDQRLKGRQILANGWVYFGKFENDKMEDAQGRLLMSNMVIYEGKFSQGKTSPTGLLMYPNGDIYFGQMTQF